MTIFGDIKHIEVDYHFIRDKVEFGDITTRFVNSSVGEHIYQVSKKSCLRGVLSGCFILGLGNLLQGIMSDLGNRNLSEVKGTFLWLGGALLSFHYPFFFLSFSLFSRYSSGSDCISNPHRRRNEYVE